MSSLTKEASGRGTSEQKARFFAVLDRVGSVTAAAAELGLNRMTCYQWTRKAGIAGKGPDSSRREELLRLRKAGLSRHEAAGNMGVNNRTAQDWDNGIRHSGSRRIYPDGQVVDYKQGVTDHDRRCRPHRARNVPCRLIDPLCSSHLDLSAIRSALGSLE